LKQEIIISLQFDLLTGEANLNEIVYRLKEINNSLLLGVLEKILTSYDTVITDRLSISHKHTSQSRKGLGRHFCKGRPSTLCLGRKVRKRGYRGDLRVITTVFGKLRLRVRVVECCLCGALYSPLLSALNLGAYSRKEMNFEQEVIEAVIDTNYRRLIDGRSIDISLGGIHNIVVGSDIDKEFSEPVDLGGLSAILADGTGLKQKEGKKGQLRTVIGVTKGGKVEPLGCFTNTSWQEIEKQVKKRIKDGKQYDIPFIYDGEPGLDDFLAEVANTQRCTWHAPRGLYHSLWEDGVKKKGSQPYIDQVKQLVGIELPEGEYEILKEEDKEPVEKQYEKSKSEVEELIKTFKKKGYQKGATYLEGLAENLFTNVEIWLKTGVITPKTTSLLERVFREIGRRLKRIAWGWADSTATNLSKMIMLRQYSRENWEKYWKEKLGIKGHFKIEIKKMELGLCQDF